ncbi:long-chain-acyl-CoA synthetase [Lutimonas halocynthiae]|uniref:long-chain-acyl-CoA synthetase n=1 Tax=Lutimonas halocynthiae TaxID=1446477 RepID=UPI0025B5D207|nr:long-chain-acyl-CoA synthetase [Lutimonas halocynthiae]MDN3643260.1 long-chain-acyl-CoA synthetase [Lutimonas halocynthiae]
MDKTPQYNNISFFDLLAKASKLVPQLPRILKNIKKTKVIKDDTHASIGKIIEANALNHGSISALKFEDQSYTYDEFNQIVNRYANYLLGEGVKNGETVISFIENRPELLFLITACAKIGAIISLINPNQRGKVLIHSMELTKSKYFMIGEELLPYFEDIKGSISDATGQKHYWISDQKTTDCPKHYVALKTKLEKVVSENPTTTQQIMAGQPYAYVFTSGTTGLPKASRQTHRKWLLTYYWFGKVNMNLGLNDVMYVPLPFYHTNALIVGWPTALAGPCTMVMRRKFSVTEFWTDVQKYKVTGFIYIGELCRYLLNAPTSDLDRSHSIKKIMGNGLRPDIWHQFKDRFQIKNIYEFYGAADGNVGFANILNFDCTIGFSPQNFRIVKYDVENDSPIKDTNGFLIPVGKGETGLLISEISEESVFDGYVNTERNEDKILRNVFKSGDHWFNSGDLLQNIGYKHARFVDRIGDTFRWKGENVATAEVEGVVGDLKCVEICAVYGVQIPNNDGRAGMVTIVKHSEEIFDIDIVAEHLHKALPKFAMPIFIRLRDRINVTHTHKIKKIDLKKEGFNCDGKIYVMLPKSMTYVEMDKNLLNDINKGVYIF